VKVNGCIAGWVVNYPIDSTYCGYFDRLKLNSLRVCRRRLGQPARHALLYRRYFLVADLLRIQTPVPNLLLDRLDHRSDEIDTVKLTRIIKSSRTEHIDLHKIRPDNIESHEEHAIPYQLRTYSLDDLQYFIGNTRLSGLATAMNVAADFSILLKTVQGSVFSVDNDRLPINEEQPDVALLRFREIFLCHYVAIATDGLKHLVDVIGFFLRNEKNVSPTRPLQGFQHHLVLRLFKKSCDVINITRDDGTRPYLFRVMLEIHLVDGVV